MTRDKFKTFGDIFDNYTNRNLLKLISQNIFDGLESPISIGKEANIFSARKKDGSKVIVKVYRLETCDFNRMYDYIRTDSRFSGIKKNRRKIIFAWAKREYVNILNAREVGIRVPLPITFRDNIMVMEFIGNTNPAPKIKDSHDVDIKNFAKKTFEYMKKYYNLGFIHGDLSEYNILEYHGKPVFIDFSQATSINNPNAEELLVRDVKNICRFFSKRGIKKSQASLMKQITGK